MTDTWQRRRVQPSLSITMRSNFSAKLFFSLSPLRPVPLPHPPTRSLPHPPTHGALHPPQPEPPARRSPNHLSGLGLREEEGREPNSFSLAGTANLVCEFPHRASSFCAAAASAMVHLVHLGFVQSVSIGTGLSLLSDVVCQCVELRHVGAAAGNTTRRTVTCADAAAEELDEPHPAALPLVKEPRVDWHRGLRFALIHAAGGFVSYPWLTYVLPAMFPKQTFVTAIERLAVSAVCMGPVSLVMMVVNLYLRCGGSLHATLRRAMPRHNTTTRHNTPRMCHGEYVSAPGKVSPYFPGCPPFFLFFFLHVGDPREGRGDVAIPPARGPHGRQGSGRPGPRRE